MVTVGMALAPAVVSLFCAAAVTGATAIAISATVKNERDARNPRHGVPTVECGDDIWDAGGSGARMRARHV
jgi:hypothetical protein